MTGALRIAATAGLAAALLTFGFIDLEVALDLGPWHANAPVADVAALALLPLGLLAAARSRGQPMPTLPWLAFSVVALASLLHAGSPKEGLHFVVRKPLFMGLAWGLGVASLVSGPVPARWTRRLLLAGLGTTATVSLVASVARIAGGGALWWAPVAGLTPNHKTLAVALAGALPLALGPALGAPDRGRVLARGVSALALLAIGASASKTAWLGAGLGLAWFLPRARPLATRPKLVIPALVAGLALMVYAPVLVGSRAMLDAARSRHSLNKRAWSMLSAHPMLGSGAGQSTLVEAVTFPDYRVNGVDAHGVLQKVGGETGLLGLAAWGWFTGVSGLALWRRRTHPTGWAAAGTFATLHLNLALSTEAYSPTHWAPLALAWGLAVRDDAEDET